jgi:four helix bundle protein
MEDGGWKMNGKNEVLELSFSFAVRIVNLCKYLQNEKREYVLSKQLLSSGTSIGANVTEAQDAQSKKDFISKIAISLKEAKETRYWISLLIETGYLPKDSKNVQSLQKELESLISLLSAISISAKNRL